MFRHLIISPIIAALVLTAPSFGAAEPAAPISREQVTLTFAPVVKKATPAVVNIYTRKVVHAAQSPFANDPVFRQFFGDLSLGRDRVQNSLGSGVLVRSSGVVITNNHVTGDADAITVVLSDRREFEARVLGKDERSDLAVLQLVNTAEVLPFLDLADSDNLEVGDLVLAIGNPFGVGQTVTSGIVSGLARTTPVGATDFRSFIQTDAAINPGNSGGALIASDGRLIGINTSIYSNSGGNIGIGFAIPANMVRAVLSSILKEGKAVRAWLGASGKSITAELARNLMLTRPTGVLIDRVTPGSPAAKAGIAVGDIVRNVNNHEVHDVDELRYVVATLPVPGKASFSTLRNGAERVLTISLTAPPDDPPRKRTVVSGRQPFAGATLANLNPAVAEEMGREYVEPAVVVVEVAPGSIAANLGIQAGDLVWSVENLDIRTMDQFMSLMTRKGPWNFVLNRNGRAYQFRVPE